MNLWMSRGDQGLLFERVGGYRRNYEGCQKGYVVFHRICDMILVSCWMPSKGCAKLEYHGCYANTDAKMSNLR